MRLIVLCAAALTGLAVGDLSRLDPARLLFGGLVALVGAGLAWRQPAIRMLALVTCAMALGGLRASLVPAADTATLEPYFGQAIRLRAVVVQPPSLGQSAVQLLVETYGIGPPAGTRRS